MRILSALSLLVVLAACQAPSFMPSGYAHHHKVYRAPPGKEPFPVRDDFSAEEVAIDTLHSETMDAQDLQR